MFLKLKFLFLLLSLALLSTACTPGVTGVSDAAGAHTLTQNAGLTSVEECPNGGVVLEHGIDSDGSGTLEAEEVSENYVLCNGADGSVEEIESLQAEIEGLKQAIEEMKESVDALKVDRDALIARADAQDAVLSEQEATLLTKANSADLSAVAISGMYSDLTNAPSPSTFASQSDLSALEVVVADKADLVSLDFLVTITDFESTIANFPLLSSMSSVAFTGQYSDLVGAPDVTSFVVAADLSEVAYTGKYVHLDEKPNLSAFVLESELNAVALTGDYADLNNTPPPYTLPSNLAALDSYLVVDDESHLIQFSGVNVAIVDGSGQTVCLDETALPDSASCNGLGNLIVGYGENDFSSPRSGSHNLALGVENGWSGYGGVVSGYANVIGGDGATIVGGESNQALADGAVAIGGSANKALLDNSVVIGGGENRAQGLGAVVVGGTSNTASSVAAVAVGGTGNLVSGPLALGLGGAGNQAIGSASVCGGGATNKSVGAQSLVMGGEQNAANGGFSTISGGQGVTIFGLYETF